MWVLLTVFWTLNQPYLPSKAHCPWTGNSHESLLSMLTNHFVSSLFRRLILASSVPAFKDFKDICILLTSSPLSDHDSCFSLDNVPHSACRSLTSTFKASLANLPANFQLCINCMIFLSFFFLSCYIQPAKHGYKILPKCIEWGHSKCRPPNLSWSFNTVWKSF